jgi:hypothetical protein
MRFKENWRRNDLSGRDEKGRIGANFGRGGGGGYSPLKLSSGKRGGNVKEFGCDSFAIRVMDCQLRVPMVLYAGGFIMAG